MSKLLTKTGQHRLLFTLASAGTCLAGAIVVVLLQMTRLVVSSTHSDILAQTATSDLNDNRLIHFANSNLNLSGLVPKSWIEAESGKFVNAANTGALIFQKLPAVPKQFILPVVLSRLEASTRSNGVSRRANGMDWTVYTVQSKGATVDFAIAQTRWATYLVVFQAPPEDHDGSYQSIFLPALDSLRVLN